MPYRVDATCPGCSQTDPVVIGLWQDHLALCTCSGCRRLVNIPLSGQCHCGNVPGAGDWFDHAGSVGGLEDLYHGSLDPGPRCPGCRGSCLTLTIRDRFRRPPGLPVPTGHDGLEKGIFVYAVGVVCTELDLDRTAVLRWFQAESPVAQAEDRRLSLPLMLDARTELLGTIYRGEAPFEVSPTARRLSVAEADRLFNRPTSGKPWWRFWG